MKLLRNIALIAVAEALIVLGLLLLITGYLWESAAVGLATFGAVALVAWRGSRPVRNSFVASRSRAASADDWLAPDLPLPAELSAVEEQMLRFGQVADPVDRHAADLALPLNAPTRPEVHLIQPRPRPRHLPPLS